MRSDTERNRRYLIKAAAELFANSPTQILHAFHAQVGSELSEFSERQTTQGMARLEAVSRWVSVVLEHGGAMALHRPRPTGQACGLS
ncbi:hypothetical protein ACWCOW_42635 [Streptomyces sp. NPDC001939]